MRIVKRMMFGLLALVLLVAISGTGFLWFDAQREAGTTGEYVALGSSFAAGPGLGESASDSPLVCMRSAGNYPALLAEKLDMRLIDMSCGGSTTEHILNGGQMFLGPQIDAIGPETQLVTITSGGNDINYIGSLMKEAGSMGVFGALVDAPQPVGDLDFETVTSNLITIVDRIRERAPNARIVILSYQAVAPATGNCDALGLSDAAVVRVRAISEHLDAAQRNAAEQSGAEFVDLHALTLAHNVCSDEPWMLGAAPDQGSAFHPNAAGMAGAAEAIFEALSQSSNQG